MTENHLRQLTHAEIQEMSDVYAHIDLDAIAARPGGTDIVTMHSGLEIKVSVGTSSVLFVPKELHESSLYPTTFIQALIPEHTNTIEINVHAKAPDGQYYHPDFRATELSLLAASYLIRQNPDVLKIAGKLVLDNRANYVEARGGLGKIKSEQYLFDEVTERRRIEAIKQTWPYRIAYNLGFTASIYVFERFRPQEPDPLFIYASFGRASRRHSRPTSS